MRQIWKYPVYVGNNVVSMPSHARILKFGEQAKALCIWALVEPANHYVNRELEIVGTGHTISDNFNNAKYVDTVIDSENYVWHCFDNGEQ